ncbi:MAG: hypothetical protein KAX49_17665 [Halanaerobiales bacterium]|nr:hypothetical protein [Halanaerobiales bacterium]
MNEYEALEILGDRATWELENMKKALEFMSMFNSDLEKEKLEAVKVLLKSRRKKIK